MAAPTLSRATFKFKNCDNYACQNPKTTMQGLHGEKSVFTRWHTNTCWRLDPPGRHKPKTQEGALSTLPACGMSPASNVGQCVTTSAAGRLGINRLEMSSLNQGNCHMKKNKQNCEKPNQLMEDFMLPVANWKYIQSNWRRPKCNEQVENGKNWN